MTTKKDGVRSTEKPHEQHEPDLASVEPYCYMDEYGNVRGSYEYWMECEGGWFPLYTSPPIEATSLANANAGQRSVKPWVPLTEFDIDQIPYSCSHADSRLIAFAIEAKLKEKNNG